MFTYFPFLHIEAQKAYHFPCHSNYFTGAGPSTFAAALPLFFMCFFDCPALLCSAASLLRLSAARSSPLSRSAAIGPLVFANPCLLIWLPAIPPAEPPPAPLAWAYVPDAANTIVA